MKGRWALTADIATIALVARVALALHAHAEPVWDGFYYDLGARRIAEGLGYSEDLVIAAADGTERVVWHAWAHYPVGYSGFLALFYKLLGAGPGVAAIANALTGAALAAVVHRLTLHAFESDKRALAAGLIAALHPGLVLYSGALMTEPLAAFLMLLSVLLALDKRWTAIAGSGIALGLATLVRPNAILLAPFLGFLSWSLRSSTADSHASSAGASSGPSSFLSSLFSVRSSVRSSSSNRSLTLPAAIPTSEPPTPATAADERAVNPHATAARERAVNPSVGHTSAGDAGDIGPMSNLRAVCRALALAVARGVAVGVIALATVAPWTLRNCRVMDACALVSTNAGWNLVIGSAPGATGKFEFLVGHTPEGGPTCAEGGQVAQDRCWFRYGTQTIKSDLRRWISLMPAKLHYTLDAEWFPINYLREARPDLVSARAHIVWGKALTGMLHLLVVVAALASVGWSRPSRGDVKSYALQIALTILLLGLATRCLDPSAPSVWPLGVAACVLPFLPLPGSPRRTGAELGAAAVILTTLATHAIFFGEDRYHLAATPAFIILACGIGRRSRPR